MRASLGQSIHAELWRGLPGATPSGPGLGSPPYLSEPPSWDYPILLHSRGLCPEDNITPGALTPNQHLGKEPQKV